MPYSQEQLDALRQTLQSLNAQYTAGATNANGLAGNAYTYALNYNGGTLPFDVYGNPVGTVPSPAAAPAGLPAEQQSAQAMLKQLVTNLGLPASLADAAWNAFLNGMPADAIYLNVIRPSAEWKAQYGVIDQLAAQGRALSETDVINLRTTYRQLMRQSGLPEGFKDDQASLDTLIANNVAPTELQNRLGLYTTAAFQWDPQKRQALQDYYGIGPGDLAAYFIDPKAALPLLQQRALAAEVGGVGSRTGFSVTRTEAEQLAQMGVTADQASQGFGTLVHAQELLNPLDAGESAISRDQALGAVFGDPQSDSERLSQQAARRRAQFGGAAGASAGRGGVAALADTSA